MEKLRVGISRCLQGERVRYDGQHKLDRYLTDTLGRFVDFVGVCPEVECGLPVPREAMRLVGDPAAPRLMTQTTHIDMTPRMAEWAERRVAELERERLCGFIFKSRSPSSGMQGVKVYNADGNVWGKGVGLFAAAFVRHFPLLPVEDDGRLHDPDIRENFIERIFTLHRYRETVGDRASLRGLMDFHARHKYLILAHSATALRDLGRLLGSRSRRDAGAAASAYERMLLEALAKPATVRGHANVLLHMMGFFKETLSPGEKSELIEVIESFRGGLVPLVVPMTLVAHYVRKYGVEYLANQAYLYPHPAELKLRNHA